MYSVQLFDMYFPIQYRPPLDEEQLPNLAIKSEKCQPEIGLPVLSSTPTEPHLSPGGQKTSSAGQTPCSRVNISSSGVDTMTHMNAQPLTPKTTRGIPSKLTASAQKHEHVRKLEKSEHLFCEFFYMLFFFIRETIPHTFMTERLIEVSTGFTDGKIQGQCEAGSKPCALFLPLYGYWATFKNYLHGFEDPSPDGQIAHVSVFFGWNN